MNQATGTFVVKLTPQEAGDNGGLGRMSEPQLSVTVVPDSGTGDLTGLSGKMAINDCGG